MLLKQFESKGSLARNDRVIVKRVDERQLLLRATAYGFFAGLVIICSIENDFRTVGSGRGDFD